MVSLQNRIIAVLSSSVAELHKGISRRRIRKLLVWSPHIERIAWVYTPPTTFVGDGSTAVHRP